MYSLRSWKLILPAVVVFLGQVDFASAQSNGSVVVPVVATFFATAVGMLIIFAIILYCCRKKWKKSARDSSASGGFDNPLVLDAKANGGGRNPEEDELQEVVTEPNHEQPAINNESYQERGVDVGDLPANGKPPGVDEDKDQVHTIVLTKTSPTNGFNIVSDDVGNIFTRDIRKDGPASGKLKEGDIIESVTVFYEGMEYEDALNVLSHAAPYKVAVSVVRGKNHLMPGDDNDKSDAFVQELQKQLEKRGSQKKSKPSPNEDTQKNAEAVVATVEVKETRKSSSSSSSSSSSEDEKESPQKLQEPAKEPEKESEKELEKKDVEVEEKPETELEEKSENELAIQPSLSPPSDESDEKKDHEDETSEAPIYSVPIKKSEQDVEDKETGEKEKDEGAD